VRHLRRKAQERAIPEAAIWQDVEFGAYTADLPLWEELAASAGGPVVELGAGSGRVSMHLAKVGNTMLALERDPELLEELSRRALAAKAMITPVPFDLAAPAGAWLHPGASADGPSEPRLAIAPLHVIQQIAPEARRVALAGLARMLRPGGLLAAVVVDESSLLHGAALNADPRPPDMRDVEGWIYSSEPLWVQVSEDRITVRRLRRRVSPGGEIERSVHDEVLHRLGPSELEEEARAAGLSPAGRRAIESGPGEADSITVLLEVPDGG
jgi:SAM-dependent methyltransferase